MGLFQKGEDLLLTIEDYTTEGNGVGHIQEGDGFEKGDPRIGFTVFVSNSLPGDRVLAEVFECKKSYARARLKKRIRPSSSRRKSPCPYADACGGCGLISWNYENQMEWKEKSILFSLNRLGGFSLDRIPMHGKESCGYRNKVNMRVDPWGNLAYSRPGTNKLFPVQECKIAQPEINRLIFSWNQAAKENPEFSSFSRLIRMVILRANEEGETMIHLITAPLSKVKRNALKSLLLPLEAEVLSRSETKGERDIRIFGPIFYGSPQKHLRQEILGNTFFLSAPSFFQVNRFLTEALYQKAMDFFKNPEELTILDLYCGIGTTSLALAKKVRQVIGVEIIPSAILNARESARFNGISNAAFLEGKAEDLLFHLIKDHEKENLAILVDPPRKGLDPKVTVAIASSGISQLVYISCNPATLARDAKILKGGGYALKKVEGFDLFPETGHVETVALMSRED